MTIREAMDFYQKARTVANHFGDIEKRCPTCKTSVGVCYLVIADCGHVACYECVVNGEDCTACGKCAPHGIGGAK